jgi:hypothetical protein
MELEALNTSGVTGQLSGNKYIQTFEQRKLQAPFYLPVPIQSRPPLFSFP